MTNKKQHAPHDRNQSPKSPRTLAPLSEHELRQVAGGVLKARHD